MLVTRAYSPFFMPVSFEVRNIAIRRSLDISEPNCDRRPSSPGGDQRLRFVFIVTHDAARLELRVDPLIDLCAGTVVG